MTLMTPHTTIAGNEIRDLVESPSEFALELLVP